MDYEHIVKRIEKTSHQAVEYFSNRSNLEKIGKITAISVATYVVADVKRQKSSDYTSVLIFFLIEIIQCFLWAPEQYPWPILEQIH